MSGIISKVKLPDGNTYNIKDNISGYITSNELPTNTSDLINDSDFQTSTQVQTLINQAISSVYRYKGSVSTYEDLPSAGVTIGDVYDVQDTGVNYAWTGSDWDALGTVIDVSTLWTKSELYGPITSAEIDAICV